MKASLSSKSVKAAVCWDLAPQHRNSQPHPRWGATIEQWFWEQLNNLFALPFTSRNHIGRLPPSTSTSTVPLPCLLFQDDVQWWLLPFSPAALVLHPVGVNHTFLAPDLLHNAAARNRMHCQEVTLLNCRLAVCYWSLLQSPAARTLVLDLKFCSLRVLLAREYHHRFFFPTEVTKSILFRGPVCKIFMEARLTAYFTYRALSSWFPQKWMMEYVS